MLYSGGTVMVGFIMLYLGDIVMVVLPCCALETLLWLILLC